MSMPSSTVALASHGGAPPDLARELRLIHAKLDALGEQVGVLYEQTRALQELRDELVPIVRDGLGALSAELSAVEHEFNAQEVVDLVRKLLHNTPTLIRTLERLESVDGLLTELEPLGKQVVRDLIDRLQHYEERGYFRLFRGLSMLLERVAEHATQEDLDRLADNVVPWLETVKRATQPGMRATANRALMVIEASQHHPVPRIGWLGLIRAMRDPEIQRGLGLLFETVRQLHRDQIGGDEAR